MLGEHSRYDGREVSRLTKTTMDVIKAHRLGRRARNTCDLVDPDPEVVMAGAFAKSLEATETTATEIAGEV